MLKTLTKKLRRHSLNEIHPFQLKVSQEMYALHFQSLYLHKMLPLMKVSFLGTFTGTIHS